MNYFKVYLSAALLVNALLLLASICSAQQLLLQNNEIAVFYEPSLDSAAGEVVRIYPELRQQLEELFTWSLDIRPQVVLVKDNRSFQKMTLNNLFVAFAVAEKNMIVIDYSRMNVHPFTLDITLKHELCHLLLHRHIRRNFFPKWLDEGICQWVSDGIGEIFVNKGWSGLDAAIISGRTIPLRRMTDLFPHDKAALMLAYEQSKSVVYYIDRQYGHGAILNLLNYLKNDETLDSALMRSLGLGLDQLEKEWLAQLERTPRWLVFLADNLYGILFFLAAILTFLGFIRLLRRRKKVYEEWEEEEEDS